MSSVDGRLAKTVRTPSPRRCCLSRASTICHSQYAQPSPCAPTFDPAPQLVQHANSMPRSAAHSLTKPSQPIILSFPHCLRPNRPTTSQVTSIHRCLLVSEIFSLILDFVRRFDESSESELKSDRNSGKRTLSALARTCRTLSSPALDALWMRLDNLDPLIKVLPRRMWAKKHYHFVVRMFMGDKQWTTFHKYAERVRSLRGPCWRVSGTAQHNVITTLAQYSKGSLPLLPNLTELVWSELKMSNLIHPCVSLIKHFAGPDVTTISLLLACRPGQAASELAVLADLPNLCPNVTSFAALFPRSSYDDYSREIGDVVRQWPHLRVLRSCALPQTAMDTIMSRRTLDTLSIELNNSSTAIYVCQLPTHVQTWSLGGNSAALCLRYLDTLQGSPANFHLRIGADDSTTGDLEALLGFLPTRLDKACLRTLRIELTSSYWSTPASDSFFLSHSLLDSISSFFWLRELDVSTFCSAELDDRGYEAWITSLKWLRSLKVGVGDVTKAKPVASVGAVLAVLRACPQLETLWMLFDASLSPPPGSVGHVDFDQKGKQRGKMEINQGEVERRYGAENRNEWGVTNWYITDIRVGHSPIGEDEKGLKMLARCLRTVMPRLERIRAERYSPETDVRWNKVQEMLLERQG